MGGRDHAVLAVLLAAWALGVGAVYRYAMPPAEATRWLRAGDLIATGSPSPAGTPAGLTARAAYLLAFHHAQDALDVAGMRVAAGRLERLGEQGLAEWMRLAARDVEASRG